MESLMNSIDESQIQNIKKYTGLKDFLDKHATRNDSSKPCTNTRIPGDKDSGIYGGSYCIPDEEQPVFLRIYYSEVLEKKTSAKKEYLTEKQRVDDGPILIDIDFRYPVAMDDRQYTTEHIEDLTDAYLSELQTIFQMDADTKFPIYVLEKPKPKKYDKENI
jgi:hypothetical protein